MPNMRLYPCAPPFLSQLILIQQETELASVATTLGPAQYFTLVRLELVKRLKADTHRDSVVIVGHAATSEVPGN